LHLINLILINNNNNFFFFFKKKVNETKQKGGTNVYNLVFEEDHISKSNRTITWLLTTILSWLKRTTDYSSKVAINMLIQL
jgi:hypothetical protein